MSDDQRELEVLRLKADAARWRGAFWSLKKEVQEGRASTPPTDAGTAPLWLLTHTIEYLGEIFCDLAAQDPGLATAYVAGLDAILAKHLHLDPEGLGPYMRDAHALVRYTRVERDMRRERAQREWCVHEWQPVAEFSFVEHCPKCDADRFPRTEPQAESRTPDRAVKETA